VKFSLKVALRCTSGVLQVYFSAGCQLSQLDSTWTQLGLNLGLWHTQALLLQLLRCNLAA
jgi:hypothetical protein